MKICFYIVTILEHYGWFEKWLIDISIWLEERYKDIEIDIITMDDNFSEKFIGFLSILKLKKINKKLLYKENLINIKNNLWNINYIKCSTFKELKNKLEQYDVIYSKNEILEAFIFKYIIWYKNIKKLIFWCHTAIYYPYWNKLHNLLYTTWLYPYLTSGVSKFHVLNSNDEKILINKRRNVVKIFNPINTKLFEFNLNNNILFDMKKDNNYYNIVWVWRLTKQKWVDFLLEIINFLSKMDKKFIKLHIAWDWELKKEIISLSNKFDFIKYYWHIENKYIPNFLSKMDLYIHTSLWESFGLTIIEANMCNLPVIAFNIPWPNDIIENWKNWILVDWEGEYFEFIENFINGKNNIYLSKDTIIKKINDDLIYNNIYKLLIWNNN